MVKEISSLRYELKYYGEDELLFDRICQTVKKLPDKVASFVQDRCVFISVGDSSWGMTLPARIATHYSEKRTKNMWLILIAENAPDNEMETLIAHEIAHAWLKHDRLGFIPDDCEITAANLTRNWGFTGKGADPDYFKQSN